MKPQLVSLLDLDGNPLWVNTAHIAALRQRNHRGTEVTDLYLVGRDAALIVSGHYSPVIEYPDETASRIEVEDDPTEGGFDEARARAVVETAMQHAGDEAIA